MNKEIQHTFHFKSDPASIKRALTEEKPLQLWWTEDVKLSKGHGIFEWRGYQWTVELDILPSSNEKTIIWACTKSNMQGTDAWEGSTMTFQLFPDAYGTRVEFLHSDYKDAPCYDACFGGWHYVLGVSLKAYLETGKGMPMCSGGVVE